MRYLIYAQLGADTQHYSVGELSRLLESYRGTHLVVLTFDGGLLGEECNEAQSCTSRIGEILNPNHASFLTLQHSESLRADVAKILADFQIIETEALESLRIEVHVHPHYRQRTDVVAEMIRSSLVVSGGIIKAHQIRVRDL